VWKTGLPVRSAVLKPHAGWLVVGWVTTSESQLLYVFYFFVLFLFWLFGGVFCGQLRGRSCDVLADVLLTGRTDFGRQLSIDFMEWKLFREPFYKIIYLRVKLLYIQVGV
jgi:hypothetical protein